MIVASEVKAAVLQPLTSTTTSMPRVGFEQRLTFGRWVSSRRELSERRQCGRAYALVNRAQAAPWPAQPRCSLICARRAGLGRREKRLRDRWFTQLRA